MKKVVVFGATGFLGSKVEAQLIAEGCETIPVGRSEACSFPLWFNLESDNFEGDTSGLTDVSGAIWLQGANLSDDYLNFDLNLSRKLFDANFYFVASSMAKLAVLNTKNEPLNFIVVTSVWAANSKINKASYSASKAAARSLVASASLDLREKNISVVGIELGVVDSPMTRANLSEVALERITKRCLGNKLVSPSDLGNFVSFLLSASARSMSGHNIVFDNGLTVGIEI